MCCFTQPIKDVSHTRIFARFGSGTTQFLAYAMALEVNDKVAMVLPIPVVKGSGEESAKFINLEKYGKFFEDMERGFPVRLGYGARAMPPQDAPRGGWLKVQSVGSYEASFVPTIKDFARLDERFRLPDKVWPKLPGYANYGFAVFKLKATHGEVHPMAFSFPSAVRGSLFFPTMHIHDGQVHEKEEFDHALYAQGGGIGGFWRESEGLASQFMKCDKTGGLVSPDQHVYKRSISGMQENGDILLKATRVAA